MHLLDAGTRIELSFFLLVALELFGIATLVDTSNRIEYRF